MGVGRAADLDVAFLANSTLEEAAGAPRRAPGFTEFFREYAKYCLSWPEDALARFDEHIVPYCAAVETASGGASGPYMHGVFVAKKQ
jgi:hypothetical protein